MIRTPLGKPMRLSKRLRAAGFWAPFFAAVCLALPAAAAGQPGRPLALLAADSRSATIEFALPAYRTSDVYSERGIEREISLPGWSYETTAGRPKLPLTGTLLQVPAGGICRLVVLEAEFDGLFGHPNPAVPRLDIDEDGRPVAVPARDTAVFGRDALYPGLLAELGEPASMRGLAVARLVFHPFQWNPVTGELRAYSRIRVRVDFDRPLPAAPGTSVEVGDAFAGMSGALVINRAGGASIPAGSPLRAGRRTAWTNAVRIETQSRGIFSVSYEDLVSQGMPQSQSPAGLKLLNRGREVAFTVRPETGAALGPGNVIEFYAEPVESDYTWSNAYWLTWEDGGGPQMASRAAAPAAGERISVFRDEIDLEVNASIWYQTPGAPETDYWFWTRLTAPMELFVSLALPEDALADGHDMRIEAAFQGRSTAGHRTSIAVNGETWSDERWEGAGVFVQTANASQSEAKIGVNVIRIKAPGVSGTVDVVYLNRIKVRYWRTLTARDNAIEFEVDDAGSGTVEVGGFSTADVEAFDVTDPDNPVALTGYDVALAAGKYVVRFGAAAASSRRYYVAAASGLGQAARIESWQAGALLGTTRQADLIVIAPRELAKPAAALAAFRLIRKVRGTFVAVEDIYNEFSDGIVDPEAIKDFLAYAYRSWRRPAPVYVALIGDATIDPKGYLADSRAQQIPAYLDLTADLGLTPSDNWYACVDGGDDIPDLMIGRIPGGTPTEAEATIDKLIAADARSQPPAQRVLLVADNDDLDFETINNKVLDVLPSDYAAVKVYLRSYNSAAQATSDIVGAIDGGVDLVSYVGHGSVTDWAAERIFGASQVGLLSNAAYLPLFCTFNCLNGFFTGTNQDCLAEAIVRAADKGGYASFSPSGLGYPWEHSLLLTETMTNLFQGGLDSLGMITTQAKIAAYAKGVSSDILKMFTLFGDPSMKALGVRS